MNLTVLRSRPGAMLELCPPAKVNDKSGLLEGDYADGRRLAMFYRMKDVQAKEKVLQRIIKKWLTLLDTQ
jgi:hypothetical protein